MSSSPEYIAYLLRLWREESAVQWRATLQNPHTGERRSFADLSSLLAFLEEQTGERWLLDEPQSSEKSEGGDGL
jgi:hypothetical protein